MFEDIRTELEAILARWERRHGRDDDADRGGLGVRHPTDRGPAPRLDHIAVRPPAPRTRLDVVATAGGKATIATRQ